jgi:hypothetical protein
MTAIWILISIVLVIVYLRIGYFIMSVLTAMGNPTRTHGTQQKPTSVFIQSVLLILLWPLIAVFYFYMIFTS